MRLYIMLMMTLPCLTMAQGQSGLYRLIAGAVNAGTGHTFGGSLIAEYLFEAGAIDTSGSGLDLILTNSASSSSGVLDLTGSSTAYAYTYSSEPFGGLSSATFSFWAQCSDTSPNWLFSVNDLGSANSAGSLTVQYRPDSSPPGLTGAAYNLSGSSYYYFRGTNYYQLADSPTNWNHYVMSWSSIEGQEIKMYLNGELMTGVSGQSGNPPSVITSQHLRIGSCAQIGVTTRYYRGLISKFLVYDKVLEQSEIDILFSEGRD